MKKILIIIVVLIGLNYIVGVIDDLKQTVAYDHLFYIQEIDAYVDAKKDSDSSCVYLYFQLGDEPNKDSCKDVIRVPEIPDGIDMIILNTKPYSILFSHHRTKVMSHNIFDLQPINDVFYFCHLINDENLGLSYHKEWSTEELERFRDSILVSLSFWSDYENCAVSSYGSLYGRYLQPIRRTEIKLYQTL